MLAKPGIASIKELKGKTICIGGLIDINRVYLDHAVRLRQSGAHGGLLKGRGSLGQTYGFPAFCALPECSCFVVSFNQVRF